MKREWLAALFVGLVVGACASAPQKITVLDLRFDARLAAEIQYPEEDDLIPDEVITIAGKVIDPTAQLVCRVNSVEHLVQGPARNGQFVVENVTLKPGPNLIEVIASKGTVSSTVERRFEKVAQTSVRIMEPQDGTETKQTWISVKAIAPSGVDRMTINDQPAQKVGDFFVSSKVEIQEGINIVTARADVKGRRETSAIRIIKDTRPPVIEIVEPKDGTFTNNREIEFVGKVDDPKAKVFVDNVPAVVKDGEFRAVVPLQAAINEIAVYAVDPSANRSPPKRIRVEFDASRPQVSVLSPKPGELVRALPLTVSVGSTKAPFSIEATLDDNPETLVTQTFPVSPGQFQFPMTELPDGSHRLTVKITDAAGNADTIKVAIATDTNPPVISVGGVEDGATMTETRPIIKVEDPNLDAASVIVTLNNRPFRSGTPLSSRAGNSGPQELLIQAADKFGNRSELKIAFEIKVNPIERLLREWERAWNEDATIRARLVEPMVRDIDQAGRWKPIWTRLNPLREDTTANPVRPANGHLMAAYDVLDGIWPDIYKSPEVKMYYEVNRDLARSGIYQELAEALAGAHKAGTFEVLELLGLELSRPDRTGWSQLTDIAFVLDVFINYKDSRRLYGALYELGTMTLTASGQPGSELYDLPIDFLQPFFNLPPSEFDAMIDFQSKIVREHNAHKLPPRLLYNLIEIRNGKSFASVSRAPLACMVDPKRGRPLEKLMENWGAFIAHYVKDPNALEITETALFLMRDSLDYDSMESLSWALRYDDIDDMLEAVRVLAHADVFDKILTDVGKILTAKDIDGRPVPYTMLLAINGFLEPHKNFPNATYLDVILDGVNRLLTKDAQGKNSLEVVTDTFLDGLTAEQRRRMGDLFKYHTVDQKKRVLARPPKYPSDATRMLRLLDIAYTPLNCGIPVAFTDVIITFNMPGVPIKFPVDNLAVAAFEASKELSSGTAKRMAGMYDLMRRMAKVGNLFCEPNILDKLVDDPEPIKAMLNDAPIESTFRMVQELAKRGDAPYLVDMLHAVYISGAAGLNDPLMVVLFDEGIFENFVETLRAVRDTRLPSDPNKKALTAFLDGFANLLRKPPHKKDRIIKPWLNLIKKLVGTAENRKKLERVLIWMGGVLVDPPPGLKLRELDNNFGDLIACDEKGTIAREFARFMDADPKNGDLRVLVPYIRAYLTADANLALSFNRLLSEWLQKGTMVNGVRFIQKWVDIDGRYRNVLQDSLAVVVRPDARDVTPADAVIYGLTHTIAPVVKENRLKIRKVLEAENRPRLHRLMAYPFKTMQLNGQTSYLEQSLPAARKIYAAREPRTGRPSMNAFVRAYRVLAQQGVFLAVLDAQAVAADRGYLDKRRDPNVIGAFAQIMDRSLQKFDTQAAQGGSGGTSHAALTLEGHPGWDSGLWDRVVDGGRVALSPDAQVLFHDAK
ncbi:MAG: hypothetical protein KIT79_07210 [Deltaproteobacteria bacterium]|nr:hypothetical protein [Deltaproteobacteria bacterium]